MKSPEGMKTMDTQIESFYATREEGKFETQRSIIFEFICANGEVTRNQISKVYDQPEAKTRIRHSSVTRTVKGLLDDGWIEPCGTRWDDETKRNVQLVRRKQPKPNDIDPQIPLFEMKPVRPIQHWEMD